MAVGVAYGVCIVAFATWALRTTSFDSKALVVAACVGFVGANLIAILAAKHSASERALAAGMSLCTIALALIAVRAAMVVSHSLGDPPLSMLLLAASAGVGIFAVHAIRKLGLATIERPMRAAAFADAQPAGSFEPSNAPPAVFNGPATAQPQSPESRAAWLTLIFCIAVFFISMAIPDGLTHGHVADYGWSEGKTGAGIIRQALDVYRAKNGGKLPGITIGPALDHADKLRLTREDFDYLTYFNADDFRIAAIDTEAGTYTLSVTGTHPDSPSGTYTLDSDGNETGP